MTALFRIPHLLGTSAALVLASITAAENIDLSTIPPRDTVQLTIYNSEDLTLVRETRHITFSEGVNPLQFSWANTLIDPTSVDLRFLTHGEALDVLDTTYPHDKPEMLYWNVASELDGEAVVEITYFTSGITWSADYVCISGSDEREMSFEGFVRITNNSGENYEDAQMRLVVGEINLVEKVAELARRGVISRDVEEAYRAKRRRVPEMPQAARRELADSVSEALAGAAMAPKEIIKEGLSEYFIFTIEGTETVRDSWSKRMRLFEGRRVPFEIMYRYRPAEYGDQLVRLFILRNDEASELGTTPLPDGVVRLSRHTGRDGLAFLIAHQTKYVPIGQEIELNLGRDPEVIHEHVRLKSRRDGFWFHAGKHRKYFSPEQGDRILPNYTVAGWDEHDEWIERIRNYRDTPIDVEIRRTFHGHVEFISELGATKHDAHTVQFGGTVEAMSIEALGYEIVTHQGLNSKQNEVTVKRAQ